MTPERDDRIDEVARIKGQMQGALDYFRDLPDAALVVKIGYGSIPGQPTVGSLAGKIREMQRAKLVPNMAVLDTYLAALERGASGAELVVIEWFLGRWDAEQRLMRRLTDEERGINYCGCPSVDPPRLQS